MHKRQETEERKEREREEFQQREKEQAERFNAKKRRQASEGRTKTSHARKREQPARTPTNKRAHVESEESSSDTPLAQKAGRQNRKKLRVEGESAHVTPKFVEDMVNKLSKDFTVSNPLYSQMLKICANVIGRRTCKLYQIARDPSSVASSRRPPSQASSARAT